MNPLVDVIHVGFPRTGTTWVQVDFLPKVKNLACLGKPYLAGKEFRCLLNQFVGENALEFSGNNYRKDFENHIQRKKNYIKANRVKIISFELLTGELFSDHNAKEFADRIKETFGSMKILVTIREQSAMIESLYRYYVMAGGNLHIREFLYSRKSIATDIFKNQLLFRKFRYDKYFFYLEKLFGKNKIKLLPFELLEKSPIEFAKEFLDFCGVGLPEFQTVKTKKRRASHSFAGVSALRLFNQIVSTPWSDSPFFRPLDHFYSRFRTIVFSPFDKRLFSNLMAERKFTDYRKYFLWERVAKKLYPKFRDVDDFLTIRNDIRIRYQESNQNTVRLTGLDLGSLGYSV